MSLEPETYLPTQEAMEGLRDLLESSLTTGHGCAVASPYGSANLPFQLQALLRHVVDAMQQGRAVTITPQSQQVTSQEAADLIGMSLTTFEQRLTLGEIPYVETALQRLVELGDVIEFKAKRREQQLAAIAATSFSPDEELSEGELAVLLTEARTLRLRTFG